MHHDSQAAILINDLDSMVHRIEALPGHPEMTRALNLVQEAKAAITNARVEIHNREMKDRFAKMDAAPVPTPIPPEVMRQIKIAVGKASEDLRAAFPKMLAQTRRNLS